VTTRVCSETLIERTAFTVLKKCKEGHIQQLRPRKARRKDEQSPGSPPVKATTQGKTWLIGAKENITLAPRCRQVVIDKLELDGKEEYQS